MSDTNEAPEGFWEDFQSYLMERFKGDSAAAKEGAPAPEPKEEEPTKETAKPKRKSWFQAD
jgi:hypothetical protein